MKSLLIVDDDRTFVKVLAEHFAGRGFEIATAHDVAEAQVLAAQFNPEWVLLDLKMPGDSGLTLIPKLLAIDPETRIVVLTGYAGIATAVEAIKLGAVHYLSKPVTPDEIVVAFDRREGDPTLPVKGTPSLSAVEREHILAVFTRNGENISATARELGMHRRTLQRKLDKLR